MPGLHSVPPRSVPPNNVPLPASFLRTPIAHRALHDRKAGRPENSPAAFRAAIAAGYGIECDIQPSADGVPMVFHDYDLRRLTGVPGRIRGLSAAKLRALRLLDGDDGIPTLAEMLALVAGRVPLLIEIKDQDGDMGPGVGPLEGAVAGTLRGYAGPVAVMSFNPHSVAALAEAAPAIPRGLTTSAYAAEDWPLLTPRVRDRLREIPDYDAVGASFLSHEAADLARPRVADLKARGAAVLCWTIRSPGAEAEARRVADNVTFEGYAATIPA
ncbi:MAG: phosphodiesterase [Rhodobacteraceae bacterium]|jgi:glycerophosphoryl diester phosphodiesterase|uniref:glycerophosphodiester phosphodiesterase family protein n=1 Tax=Albidovulum sp. TaxID=1872424 RepID=UPI001D31147A|nr:phosphodiesterase [Paracoccaceae bacterium]MCC0071376.1 phosphodiesterase [Paracoccaceae bacterium]